MAKNFDSIDEVLDFAMSSEQEAVDFYNQLASQMKNQEIKEIFLDFAREEVSHKAKLQQIKTEKIFDFADERIQDLEIADYMVNIKPKPDMNYADALVLAMQKEKAAFRLYTKLAERSSDAEIKKVFQNLAMEESKHKLRFELEYDEHVMREN